MRLKAVFPGGGILSMSLKKLGCEELKGCWMPGRVFIHPASVNFSCGSFPSGWLVYTDIVETSKARRPTPQTPCRLHSCALKTLMSDPFLLAHMHVGKQFGGL